MSSSSPVVSVLICTCNPNEYTFDWVLDTLAQQTLPASQFEIIVVDNNSRKALEAESLRKGRRLPLRVVRELRQGKVFACCTAIKEARAPLLIIVDDDNGLAVNYLEEAARIARTEPGIGAYAGITKLLSDQHIPAWKQGLILYLGVRDFGPDPITSNQTQWGKWEPIGAGMVFRREVGIKFIECVEGNPEARQLSRRGKSYICGEDTLLARAACWAGYSCSYQPSLWLSHFIKGSRLNARELAHTIQGCAQAWVINERLCGRPPADISWVAVFRELWARLRYRISRKGFRHGTLEWFWDVGQFKQTKASARMARIAGANQRHKAVQGDA